MACIAGVIAAAITAPSAIAQVKTGWYGQLSLGGLWAEDNDGNVSGIPVTAKYDNGAVIWGAVGYRFGNGIRTDLELGYARIGIDKIQVFGTPIDIDNRGDLITGTINAFYDIHTGSFLTPYLGGGIGFAHAKSDDTTVIVGGQSFRVQGKDSTDLTVFGELGVALRASERVEIVPAYRYQWIDDAAGGFGDDVAHIARIGVRVFF
jgi:opacity protein-like surface antigen